VLAVLSREDAIICQITSQPYGHPHSVPITAGDYVEGMGRLPRESFVLPHRLVTASSGLFERVVGRLTRKKTDEVTREVSKILS
jgi:mRNA-degrading endonuclease toxin of MazEF toxin-antitoxin module